MKTIIELFLEFQSWLDLVVHTFSVNPQEAEAGESETSLVYTVSSRTVTDM